MRRTVAGAASRKIRDKKRNIEIVANPIYDIRSDEARIPFMSSRIVASKLRKQSIFSYQKLANLDSVKANLDNAELILNRRLQVVGIGGVSQEETDTAQATRNEQLGSFFAAKAALAVAIDNMNYTEVFAPTDGIILTRIREPGTVVNPSDPVYTLSVCSPVWVRAYVDETHLGDIYYGMRADVYTDSGKKYSGTVGFISPVAEFTPKTVETTQLRTDLVYRLRVYADNPDRYLKQGMPVTVKLYINESEKK